MLSVERMAARNTLSAYARDLQDYSRWLAVKGRPLATASSEDIRAYLADLGKSKRSPTTQARRLSSLRQFYKFLLAEGIIKADPARIIAAPRRPRSLPQTLSEHDVEALLETAAARIGKTPPATTARLKAARLYCLIELLYATGLRVSELVSLPLSAVRADDRVLRVVGKGGKTRLVPLNASARTAIEHYLEARTAGGSTSGAAPGSGRFLFPSRAATGHLTRHRFGQLLKALALEAGLASQKISPHTLRHAFASHLLAHGADLRVLQEMLGHADISTTQIYTHVLETRLRELVEQHHPLSDLVVDQDH